MAFRNCPRQALEGIDGIVRCRITGWAKQWGACCSRWEIKVQATRMGCGVPTRVSFKDSSRQHSFWSDITQSKRGHGLETVAPGSDIGCCKKEITADATLLLTHSTPLDLLKSPPLHGLCILSESSGIFLASWHANLSDPWRTSVRGRCSDTSNFCLLLRPPSHPTFISLLLPSLPLP